MYNTEIEDFSTDFDKSKKLLTTLNSEVQQKHILVSQGRPTNSVFFLFKFFSFLFQIDASLREKIRKIEQNVKTFQTTLKDWESNPELYNITLREIERRRNQISELNNSLQEMKNKAFSEHETTSLNKEREQLFKDGKNVNQDKNKKFTVEETLVNQKAALKSFIFLKKLYFSNYLI